MKINKTNARKYLTEGNAKLSNEIAIWSVIAKKEVCGMVCKGCYAIKAQNGRHGKSITPSRERKYSFSQSNEFIDTILASIVKLDKKYVRIHESGEFYSQEYINKWCYIATSLPGVTFVAYTKRLKDFDFSILKSLENVIIIDSLHGGKINFGSILDKPKDALICPAYTAKNADFGCLRGCDLCYKRENKSKLEARGLYFVQH